MKVLVLGADGMLGHQLVRTLDAGDHEVVAATRRPPDEATQKAFGSAVSLVGVDARVADTVVVALGDVRPDVVVNAIGIVKQRDAAQDALPSIRINSLFPHELASWCRAAGARLIHISTDCVFSGRQGSYTEADIPDPIDLYGRSKLLGEVGGAGCVTLRTSIIGLELFQKTGLIEWFLRQTGRASGWSHAMYSGVTTAELSRQIGSLITDHAELSGVWHLSANPISKLDLLVILRDMLQRDIELVPDDSVRIDRTMHSERFRVATGYKPPTWTEMLTELADEIRRREAPADNNAGEEPG